MILLVILLAATCFYVSFWWKRRRLVELSKDVPSWGNYLPLVGHSYRLIGDTTRLTVSAIIDKTVGKVKLVILKDRRLKQWEIAKDVGISNERVNEIINEYLGTAKQNLKKRRFSTDDEKKSPVNQYFDDKPKKYLLMG
ncbi:hypothetical protein EVAR_29756_1 [Eumeta japonica]|uniref:Uncharacterized protein n=1 Tax=Eumeta variegata TaxID=151549 RepID=A0A4C1WXX1_EUMVA|nr:hypothetical protein EVAR_29756_1 [Eumeta japonica]